MATWTIRTVQPQTKWSGVIAAMCNALDSDESAEFARVGEYVDKTVSVSHVRKTLAKFPALDARFSVVSLEDGDARDVGLVRK